MDASVSTGLTLMIYIEKHEYIEGLTQGEGMRVVIHPYNTMPFVTENGVAVSPGQETFIGMRMYCYNYDLDISHNTWILLTINFFSSTIKYDLEISHNTWPDTSFWFEQFISDFGGTIGLWVGASFITGIELLEFLFQLIIYCG
ncbi:hypothetical protein LSH36_26g10055, partial [Paralvinella palmiformis]